MTDKMVGRAIVLFAIAGFIVGQMAEPIRLFPIDFIDLSKALGGFILVFLVMGALVLAVSVIVGVIQVLVRKAKSA